MVAQEPAEEKKHDPATASQAATPTLQAALCPSTAAGPSLGARSGQRTSSAGPNVAGWQELVAADGAPELPRDATAAAAQSPAGCAAGATLAAPGPEATGAVRWAQQPLAGSPAVASFCAGSPWVRKWDDRSQRFFYVNGVLSTRTWKVGYTHDTHQPKQVAGALARAS